MKNVLVTGGLGFIGSHSCVELLNSGYNVLVIDNLSNSEILVRERITQITGRELKFYDCDLTDFKKSSQLFETNAIDAVIHFAASKAVGESVENPLGYYKNNLLSLINILELCKNFQVNRLVFSSSCTVYGQPDQLPVTESTS